MFALYYKLMKQVLLTILAIVCLWVSFLSSGIMICTYCPAITQNLSRATALVDSSKFNRDQLVLLADTTRAFVAGNAEKKDLYSIVEQINKEAKTQYAELEGSDFAAVASEYALDSNCISHLEDVKSLLANIKIAFGICSFAAIAFLILLFVFCGRSAFGRAIMWAGSILLLVLIIFVVWAIVDFNSLFNWLHSLFFTNGSWIFNETSLLISMYPSAFWAGMATICVASSAILSIISIFIGKIIK